MLIRDAMTKTPACCKESDSASMACATLWEKDCGLVPVVNEGGQLVSVVTDRDICFAAHFRDSKISELRLGDIGQGPVQCLRPDQSLQEAQELMQQAQLRRIPIVDANQQVVGILSLNDIAIARKAEAPVGAEEIADTLGAICSRSARAA